MQKLLQETVGFAACELARRTLGIAGVADIRDIENLETRSKLEVINLKLSMLLMQRYNSVVDIEDVVTMIYDYYRAQPNI